MNGMTHLSQRSSLHSWRICATASFLVRRRSCSVASWRTCIFATSRSHASSLHMGGGAVLSGTIVWDSLFGAMMRLWGGGSGEDHSLGGRIRISQYYIWEAKEVLTSPLLTRNIHLPFPQLYAMAQSIPFGPGSSIGTPSVMENMYQLLDPQSRWQPNGADPNVDPSLYPRVQGLPMPIGFGANVRRISCRIYFDTCQTLMRYIEWGLGRHC